MTTSEKIRLIRKAHGLTQDDFARSIGISRGNLANIEAGKVTPTLLLINCVALMYNVDKSWLLDDNNDDLGALNGSANILSIITDKYKQLDDNYKLFVENQINQLLDIQSRSNPDT